VPAAVIGLISLFNLAFHGVTLIAGGSV
jgi:hypothetical protein